MEVLIFTMCFTNTEDSAPLGSDTSAVLGLQEAVLQRCCLFYCLLETKALNPGVRGSAPAAG